MLTDWLNEELLECGHALWEKERGREREGEREGERGRERDVEYGHWFYFIAFSKMTEWLILFLTGMTGALAPFSYLVSR